MSFTDSPLMDALHKRWVNGEFSIDADEVYSQERDFSKKLDEDIKFRMLNQKNFAFDFYSFYGRGKSTIAQYLGKRTHSFIMSKYCKHLVKDIEEKYGRKPEFDVSNLCFDTTELLKRLNESVPMETFVYDEARSEKVVGSGSKRQEWDKERILKRVRVLQHNFILCDPLADESKISNLCIYKFKPIGIDYEKKLNRSILFGMDEETDRYEMVGHVITPFCEIDGYIEKKKKHARDVELMAFGGERWKVYEKIATNILENGLKTKENEKITSFKFQDWTSLLEIETGFQYAKDEIKIINQFIRAKTARLKQKVEKSKKQ